MSKPDSRWKTEPEQVAATPPVRPSGSASDVPLPPKLPSEIQSPDDLVIHREAPPIVRAGQRKSKATSRGPKKDRANSSPFQLHLAEQQSHGHGESTSWFSSVVIHLIVLAIIALFLVPADYGGQGMHVLTITFGDGSDPGAGAAFSVETAQEEETVPEVVPVTETGAEPAAVSSGAKAGKVRRRLRQQQRRPGRPERVILRNRNDGT